jgi:hypothetical protein
VKRGRRSIIINTRWANILIEFRSIVLLIAVVFRTLRGTSLQLLDFRSEIVDNLLMGRFRFLDTEIYSAKTRPQCVDSNCPGPRKSWIWWVLGWRHHI